MVLEEAIARAAELLAASRYAVAFTGAGVSTESGIPDFRGPQGLWKRVDPNLFTIDYFEREPLTVWRLFVSLFLPVKRGVKPNPAHYALARLEELGIVKAVVTQNVDGLHQAAGSKNVIELHGNLREAVCMSCGYRMPLDWAVERVKRGMLPRCPRCDGLVKPAVVFFGERLPEEALERAFEEVSRADLVLVVGSSLTVYPAAYLPAYARSRGARLIIVNLEPTPLDHAADVVLRGRAGVLLPRLVEEVEKRIAKA